MKREKTVAPPQGYGRNRSFEGFCEFPLALA